MEYGRKLNYNLCRLLCYVFKSVETNENARVLRRLQPFLDKHVYK